MRITDEEMKIRREHMIRVAYQLFNQHGIDSVSLGKIAVEAGVSLKSVSRYFSSKTQLVEQTQIILWKEIVDHITLSSKPARLKTESGLEELKIILLCFETLYKNHSDYVMFFYDYQSYMIRKHNKLSEALSQGMLNDVRSVFLHSLERGQKDGSVTTEETPIEQFRLLWGIVRYYVEHLVIHSQLYEGENPWIVMFPKLIEKAVKMVKK